MTTDMGKEHPRGWFPVPEIPGDDLPELAAAPGSWGPARGGRLGSRHEGVAGAGSGTGTPRWGRAVRGSGRFWFQFRRDQTVAAMTASGNTTASTM